MGHDSLVLVSSGGSIPPRAPMNTHLQLFNDPSVEFLGTFDGDDQEQLAQLMSKTGLVMEDGKIIGYRRIVVDDYIDDSMSYQSAAGMNAYLNAMLNSLRSRKP